MSNSSYLFNSVYSVDEFCSRFNHANNYDDGTTKLNLGDNILIKDGTYDQFWYIVGFDCEYSRTATDGTTYDNGYGIMLFPSWLSTTNAGGYWNTDNTVAGGYMNSLAHTNTNQIAINMKNGVFGTHLVNRNVLLSSSVNSSTGRASGYAWTTDYGTLITEAQIKGIIYDSLAFENGEANYKLPIFNYIPSYNYFSFWLRELSAKENSKYKVLCYDYTINRFITAPLDYGILVYAPLLYIR